MSALFYVDPIRYPQYWDVVYIAGVPSPGVCEIKEWKRVHDWDVKKGKGSIGAKLTFVQKPPAEGAIEFLLWDNSDLSTGRNHFLEWDRFVPLLKYDPTKKKVQGVPIYHPSLEFIDVSLVVTTKIGNPIHKGQGLYSITVDFLEDFPSPAKNATGSPTVPAPSPAPPPAGPGNPPPNAPDALQQEIAQLAGQAFS
jgi:hypothetical protein